MGRLAGCWVLGPAQVTPWDVTTIVSRVKIDTSSQKEKIKHM